MMEMCVITNLEPEQNDSTLNTTVNESTRLTVTPRQGRNYPERKQPCLPCMVPSLTV